ncbi:hypothetical protein [Puia sp.]|jgi:hypothetical protein|uniref:hypothetical protein n=1 Tax=Puia sp. TaxID=2045100 RepID=UPI002F3FAA99
MEVHHHPQLEHKPKPWVEYILEYLMIVLAVITGFFAESLREQISDKSKEKEYLASMFNELKYDTSQYHAQLNKITQLNPVFDSCFINVKEAPRYHYTLLARWNTPVNELGPGYKPTLPTIGQLKSSGNLRLLHDKDIVRKILEYESFIYGDYMGHYQDCKEASKQVYAIEDEVCDYGDFLAKLDSNMRNVAGMVSVESSALYDMPILIKDPQKLNLLANSFVNFKANNFGYTTALNRAMRTATELLELIDKKYEFGSVD